jgi:hypothetical protein
MGSCAAQIFTNISSDQFACLVGKANAAGIAISGNVGNASKDGITIQWSFDAGANTLTIQCTSSPFLVPCGTINSKIDELVDSCLT